MNNKGEAEIKNFEIQAFDSNFKEIISPINFSMLAVKNSYKKKSTLKYLRKLFQRRGNRGREVIKTRIVSASLKIIITSLAPNYVPEKNLKA